MECNRDEAIRAKIIAEKKLTDKDFAGAKKFTLKAQTLYPGLDGISQMLITINVYLSSEKKVKGESDWYGILDAKPSDDDETIRKQYRKLVLMLHPDKNKSVGADGAFKIFSEAWSLLSDKSKRSAYNQRRNPRAFQQKVSFPSTNITQTGPARVPPTVPVRPQSQPHHRPRAPPPAPAPAPGIHRSDTFWTICNRCKMHYEYIKLYLNHTLLCPRCHKPFLAVEMPKPVNFPTPAATGWTPSNIHWGPSSGASMGGNVVEKVNERWKRECEEFNAQRLLKRRKKEDGGQSSNVKAPYRTFTRN